MYISYIIQRVCENLHCEKVSEQKMYIPVDGWLMVSFIKLHFMLERAEATLVKLTKIQASQELVFDLAGISKLESRDTYIHTYIHTIRI